MELFLGYCVTSGLLMVILSAMLMENPEEEKPYFWIFLGGFIFLPVSIALSAGNWIKDWMNKE